MDIKNPLVAKEFDRSRIFDADEYLPRMRIRFPFGKRKFLFMRIARTGRFVVTDDEEKEIEDIFTKHGWELLGALLLHYTDSTIGEEMPGAGIVLVFTTLT